MKKILTIAVALSAVIFSLSSCTDINESIKNTRWTADLSVYDGIDTGEAVLSFTSNGYRFQLTARKEERPESPGYINSEFSVKHIGDIFYEYPIVRIPYLKKDGNGNEVTYYWTGTVSEDGKQMTINEFDGLFFDSSMTELFRNVVFTRQ
ncbi:MAG: hypothetical protein J5699_02645 [Bacteroidales bacterium]|nr:hypothetical protein [Bacteroidales bacterium]